MSFIKIIINRQKKKEKEKRQKEVRRRTGEWKKLDYLGVKNGNNNIIPPDNIKMINGISKIQT